MNCRWCAHVFLLILLAGYGRAGIANTAPTVANPIPDQAAAEDEAFSFAFADNTFTDADPGDTLTYSASLAGGGELPSWLSFDGGTRTFFGTPASNDVGAVTVKVTATDSAQASADDDFVITVSDANDAPDAVDDSFTVEADSSNNTLDVLANDTDPDMDDGRSIAAHGTPSNGGAVSIAEGGGSLSYTPAAGFSGTETFSYTLQDSAGASDSATVTVTVNAPEPPPNTAPEAEDDSYSTDEDTVLNVSAPGTLGNDRDGDGDALSAVVVDSPESGALEFNNDGSFSYTPARQFSGSDRFTYRASDGSASSNTATVRITVAAADDAPVASHDSYSTAEDVKLTVAAPGVLDNDRDADGDDLSAAMVSGPVSGTLILKADGSFTYQPHPDFNGTDSFTYRASAGGASSAPATVTITVGVENDKPVAEADEYTAVQRRSLSVAAPGLLDNDRDPDGDNLGAVLVSPPASGTVGLNANGSFSYTPHGSFTGEDGFEYQVSDGRSRSNVVPVTIKVEPSDEPPPNRTSSGGSGGSPSGTLLALLVLAGLARRRLQA